MQMQSSFHRAFFALCIPTALLISAEKSVPLPEGGTVSAKVEGQRTVLFIRGVKDAASTVALKPDDTVDHGTVPGLKVLGELGSTVLIFEDTYYSRSGGLSECKAGKEQFLRVVALGQPNRQTLMVKLASCQQNLELADDGVNWNAQEGMLEIHWLTNPAASNTTTYAKYLVSKDGGAKLINERKR